MGKVKYYACNKCGVKTRRSKGWCIDCERQYDTRKYTGDHCGCKGLTYILAGSAITYYRCSKCQRIEWYGNTCTPVVCFRCGKSNQCLYCGRLNANRLFDERWGFLKRFHMSKDNLEWDDDCKYNSDLDKIVKMSDKQIDKINEHINERYGKALKKIPVRD